jgi:hypothetical protein
MYQNSAFGGKWFYAFITKMEFINENRTDITIETDVYQTWLFDTSLKESFVVREHVAKGDDIRGAYLLDEGLDTGEYKMRMYEKSDAMGELAFVLGVSDVKPILGYDTPIGAMYGGIYSGLAYFAFDEANKTTLKNTIWGYSNAGKLDAIVVLFTIPKAFLQGVSFNGGMIPDGTATGVRAYSYTPTFTDIDGYTPKNNKMFCYPYNVFYVSNNNGHSAEYRFEDFSTAEMDFYVYANISPSPQAICVPLYFKGQHINYEHGVKLDGFPLCSWNNDIYANWLAQNAASTVISLAGDGLAVGMGIGSGNVLSTAGGIAAAAQQLAQVYKASLQPAQAKGNTGAGSLNCAIGIQDFYMSHMTIKAEYAKRIDDFLTMYGYKVNAVKVPNTNTRSCWNYVQTIDCNITGHIPTADMKRLKQMFNDGVTLWHSGGYVGNYSLDNN